MSPAALHLAVAVEFQGLPEQRDARQGNVITVYARGIDSRPGFPWLNIHDASGRDCGMRSFTPGVVDYVRTDWFPMGAYRFVFAFSDRAGRLVQAIRSIRVLPPSGHAAATPP